jgi:hypothetical protein
MILNNYCAPNGFVCRSPGGAPGAEPPEPSDGWECYRLRIVACAAAKRAIGTRYGEQLT